MLFMWNGWRAWNSKKSATRNCFALFSQYSRTI